MAGAAFVPAPTMPVPLAKIWTSLNTPVLAALVWKVMPIVLL
jgi:hypothetical protein